MRKNAAKKVAIFLTDLGGGGAERVMVNLANGFANDGFEVDLLLVKQEGVYLSQLSPKIQLIDLKAQKLWRSFLLLVLYLRRVQPENLVTALEDTNIVATLARLVARVPTRLIVSVHNNLSRESMLGQSFKRRAVPNFLRWIYPFTDSVVAVSEGVANDLKDLGVPADKIQVIYNPIVTPDFETLAAAEVAHPWLTTQAMTQTMTHPREEPIVLGIGRLALQKDFGTLIRAIALARQHRPVRLMILGEGALQAPLEALYQQLGLTDQQAVDFPGFVGNPLAYMARVDVCAVSSSAEGFGNVLVESMGVGTPVVSTNCPSGPAEILEQGNYGPLVPVGDPQRLADAILSTLDHPIEAAKLKRRAADFSVEVALAQYRKLLA